MKQVKLQNAKNETNRVSMSMRLKSNQYVKCVTNAFQYFCRLANVSLACKKYALYIHFCIVKLVPKYMCK